MRSKDALAVSSAASSGQAARETFERISRSQQVPVVGLDLRATEPGFKSHFGRGTGRYAAELVAAIERVSSAESSDTGLRGGIPPIDIRLLGSAELSPSEREKRLVKKMPLGRMTVETQLLFPFRVSRLKTDLVHFFHHGDAPAWCPVRYVVTVLDLIPLKFPNLYQTGRSDWRYRVARALELRAIRSASGIIAISDATKRDLIDILGVSPDRISVTKLAVGDQFNPGGRFSGGQPVGAEELSRYQSAIRSRLGIPADRPLLLYVGGIDQRKQVPFLFDVMCELNKGHAGLNPKPLLVLAGNHKSDRHYPELLAAIERLGLSQDVHLTGYLAEEDLLDLYRAADLTLFPSLYEGFGFPVLESMSSGVPVIARSNSSIPELVGFEAVSGPQAGNGAVLMPDSAPASAWAEEISRLISSDQARLELGAAGVSRAATFSWDRTARETLFAYKQFSFTGMR